MPKDSSKRHTGLDAGKVAGEDAENGHFPGT
jgi:hypothetical protein